MKRLLIVPLLFGLAAGELDAQSAEPVPEGSAPPAAPAADPPPQREPDDDIVVEGEVPERQRRVCETRVATGSIMPKRVCRTVAQIEQERRRTERDMDELRTTQDTETLTHLLNTEGG